MGKIHPIYLGCAGWSIRREYSDMFIGEGTHLTRYSKILNAVEINSTFKKNHMPKTFSRWAEETSVDFRFSVKMPKIITHDKRFRDCGDEVKRFIAEISGLGEKLGPILIQLPPGFAFQTAVATKFFQTFRKLHFGLAALEARHTSWFEDKAIDLLQQFSISTVDADPAPVLKTSNLITTVAPHYIRLHGTPRVYYSSYDQPFLERLAKKLSVAAKTAETWCIFDNTAEGHAFSNCIETMNLARALRNNPLPA